MIDQMPEKAEMRSMKKVVFFGSIGLAKRILVEIILKQDIQLVGVCCEKNINAWRQEESVYDYCVKNNIAILEDSDVIAARADLGISVRYNRIINQNVINSFSLGIVNTHGGILPEYRGSYCNVNAILNGEKEYGVTLHYIDAGIDEGDIIAIKKVDILPDHTGFDLYHISESLCYDLIADNIIELLNGTNLRIPQSEFIKNGHKTAVYRAKDTLQRKRIMLSEINEELTLKIVRAFDSDVHEPAYIDVAGRKIYFRMKY